MYPFTKYRGPFYLLLFSKMFFFQNTMFLTPKYYDLKHIYGNVTKTNMYNLMNYKVNSEMTPNSVQNTELALQIFLCISSKS